MTDGFPVRLLGDLTENLDAKRRPVKASDRRAGPYPYYGAQGIVDRVDSYLFDGEFVLVAEDGENLRSRKEPVALMANGRFWVNNHAHILRGNANANTRFLFYAINASDISGYVTGSTIPKLSQGNLNRIQVLCPPPREQCAIASILGAFDDKIDLNCRTNETLEAMARAIFKDWFVDFGPTCARKEGRTPYLAPEIWRLFPDRLDDEGKPEGWSFAKLGDLCARVAMGPFGSDITADNFVNHGVPIIRGGNLKTGFVDHSFVYVTEAKADALRNANAFSQDIIITHRGTLGQVGIIPKEPAYPRYVVSQSQMLLTANPERTSPRFIFEFLRSERGMQQLLAFTSQVGVPAIARPTASLKSLSVLSPSRAVLHAFDDLLAPLVECEAANIAESRTLTNIRDLLLPKLMSGEIRVKDAEKIAEAVA